MANGTLRILASVLANNVLPQPVGPMSRMLDLSNFDVGLGFLGGDKSLVVIVHGDRQDLLGPISGR